MRKGKWGDDDGNKKGASKRGREDRDRDGGVDGGKGKERGKKMVDTGGICRQKTEMERMLKELEG